MKRFLAILVVVGLAGAGCSLPSDDEPLGYADAHTALVTAQCEDTLEVAHFFFPEHDIPELECPEPDSCVWPAIEGELVEGDGFLLPSARLVQAQDVDGWYELNLRVDFFDPEAPPRLCTVAESELGEQMRCTETCRVQIDRE